MKRNLFLIITTVFFFFISTDTFALTAQLTNESDNTKTFNILAEPPQESSAIQFRVTVSGGTITAVEQGDSNKLSFLPACDNGNNFQDDNICTEIASIGGLIESDQVLLTVTVESTSGDEVIFAPNSDHGYLTINSELVSEEGVVLETYPLTTVEEQPAPIIDEISTNEDSSLPFVLLLGILVVLVGAFVVIIYFTGKEPKKQIN